MTGAGTMNAKDFGLWLGLGAAINTYPNSAALLVALTTFAANSEALIGRKCEVTYIGGETAAGLHQDAGTLIL